MISGNSIWREKRPRRRRRLSSPRFSNPSKQLRKSRLAWIRKRFSVNTTSSDNVQKGTSVNSLTISTSTEKRQRLIFTKITERKMKKRKRIRWIIGIKRSLNRSSRPRVTTRTHPLTLSANISWKLSRIKSMDGSGLVQMVEILASTDMLCRLVTY